MLLALLLLTSLTQFYELSANLLFEYGPEAGDSPGPGRGNTTYVHSFKRFRVFGKRFRNLYICSNGYVALGRRYCLENPTSIADGHALLAPFWVAQDTSPASDGRAKIWYRATRDPAILDKTVNQLSGYFNTCKPADFRPLEVIIVTWENSLFVDSCQERGIAQKRCTCLFNLENNVDPRHMWRYCDCMEEGVHGSKYCECVARTNDTSLCRDTPKGPMEHSNTKRSVPANTYQIAIASDKSNTFVIFSYEKISWIYSKQFVIDDVTNEEYPTLLASFIGFVSRQRAFYALPQTGEFSSFYLPVTSNVGTMGVLVYKVNGLKVQDPKCEEPSVGKQVSRKLLYPYGNYQGDRAGPTVGEAHLIFDNGIPFFNKLYHDVWASSFGRVSFATDSPNVLSGEITPGINAFFARQDLRSSYQSDDVYADYDAKSDPDVMLSKHFWYRVTSDPVLLARAQWDLQNVSSADFMPNSLAIITWYHSQSVDECARHGFRPEFCECEFVTNTDPRCACLTTWLIDHNDDFNDYYNAAEGDCDNTQSVKESDIFLESGPYTEVNSYQVVLVTDSVDTYVMLHYSSITWYKNHFFYMKYINGPRYPRVETAKVSIDNGTTASTFTHPYSETSNLLSLPTESNVGVPGRFVYKVSGNQVEE